MADTFDEAYQAMVMKFAVENNHDLEVDYEWPPELDERLRVLTEELQITFGRKPL